MSDEMDEYVKALDGTHNPSSVEDGFSSYTEGQYQVRLDKLYFSKSKEKQEPMCVFDFEVIAGEFASRKILKFAKMINAEQLDYLTKDFRRLGITAFRWSDVQEKFKDVLDKLFLIELKTNSKGFQSVYIQREIKSDSVMVSNALKEQDDVKFI